MEEVAEVAVREIQALAVVQVETVELRAVQQIPGVALPTEEQAVPEELAAILQVAQVREETVVLEEQEGMQRIPLMAVRLMQQLVTVVREVLAAMHKTVAPRGTAALELAEEMPMRIPLLMPRSV